MTATRLGEHHGPIANKSGPKSGTFTGKGDPRNGRGPAKGAPNAGRPPDQFKAEMRQLLNNPKARQRLRELMQTEDGRLFLDAWSKVADRAYGKPAQVIEGGDERKPLVIRLVRESAS